ncbi:Hypothetical protein, putative [Bodo saltans]|uniref:Uncharacterized protein n=1 Tax=Bodo saltans TaxID=75058 RepID=A0A0S4JCH8_BODSA|nr:Hypothetical protein, putative [Bodo saltans]|eukprot:CUG87830.1 Hypothetical protein, putative [Bodo saltans]
MFFTCLLLSEEITRDSMLSLTVTLLFIVPLVLGDVAWHKPHHPDRHAGNVGTIPPYSLNAACASETRELCEVRSPYSEQAIQCFESRKSELSPNCATWHEARMQCKGQIAASTMDGCPECRGFCGERHSLMHCIRAAGSRIRNMGVDDRCTDTDFFRSINRRFKR